MCASCAHSEMVLLRPQRARLAQDVSAMAMKYNTNDVDADCSNESKQNTESHAEHCELARALLQ